MTELDSAAASRLDAFREPSFCFYLPARFASAIGSSIVRAALAWQVYQLTGSALHLGFLGLVEFVPTLLLSLLAGAYADAHDRVRIVRITQTVALGVTLALFWTTAEQTATVATIYALVVVHSIAMAFEHPAASSILPTLVPRSVFPHAVTISSSVRNAGRLAGPAIFGFVAHSYDVAATYVVGAALTAVALAGYVFVRSKYGAPERRPPSLESVFEGLRFVRSRPAILGAMTLDMVAVIFGGAVALLPIYAEILELGPRGYGVLAASLDAGTILVGLTLIVLPPIRRAGRAMLIAVAGFGLATILFGISREFWLSVTAMVLAGMSDGLSMVARQMLIQLGTPDRLRGRVSSVNMLFISASNELGAAESGLLAAATSATFSVVFGGAVCLVALALAAVLVPALRDHDLANDDPEADADQNSA